MTASVTPRRPGRQGFTVFFTGLSGAGKSTLANALHARLMEIGSRSITLLDGDIVRRNLSSELGFSKEHRDLNVQRIGFVAGEITRHGGITICAAIAPYHAARNAVRNTVLQHGGFYQVHVSTRIEVCEARDRKGLYAKARAGLVQSFTGVNDPYEIPLDSEISVDTEKTDVDEAINMIIARLIGDGFLPRAPE